MLTKRKTWLTWLFSGDNQEYYTVQITTSDDYGAGTDAHVKIKLIGNKATTPAITLDNPNHDDFEAGR